MKSFAIAALVAASSVNAFDAEFMRGAQTGAFLTSEDQFEDYSCPPAKPNKQIQMYLDMGEPMILMMKNMNKGESNPVLE